MLPGPMLEKPSSRVRMVKLPAEVQCAATQQQDHQETKPGRYLRSPEGPAPAHDNPADQRSHSIDIHAQDYGDTLSHEIAQHATAHSRYDAQCDGKDVRRSRPLRETGQSARNRKRSQADGIGKIIEEGHAPASPTVKMHDRVGCRYQHCRHDGHQQIRRFRHGHRRRDAGQHIATMPPPTAVSNARTMTPKISMRRESLP